MSDIGNLVITRHRGEAVVIGHNVTVTVVEVRGDKVRLSFQAPKELAVNRLEVREAIQREHQRGVTAAPKPVEPITPFLDQSLDYDPIRRPMRLDQSFTGSLNDGLATRVAELESSVPRRRSFADLKDAGLTVLQMAYASGSEPLDAATLELICLAAAREIRELQATILCGIDASRAAIAAMDAIGEPERRRAIRESDERFHDV